jgi:hypothetical protein
MDKDEVFLSAAQVKRRYGGITDMTLWRWGRNPDLDFPTPTEIAGRRYWRLSALVQFEVRRAFAKKSDLKPR